MKIKAIETEYHGYRFRSRLEARWAVYFDVVNLDWEYEREGFRLRSGPYLPDFWLATISMWAEVKPVAFNPTELKLAYQLARMTKYPVLMLVGTPKVQPYTACLPDGTDFDHEVCQYKNEGRAWSSCGPDDLYQPDRLSLAVTAARSARFEHGEHTRPHEMARL